MIKKITLTILHLAALFILSTSAYAQITMLDSVTATGNGSSFDIGYPYSRFTCSIQWGGTTPTNTVVTLQGSIDNSAFVILVTHTSTASPDMFHAVNYPVRYIRGGYSSKSGGDGTTTVTMKCIIGRN